MFIRFVKIVKNFIFCIHRKSFVQIKMLIVLKRTGFFGLFSLHFVQQKKPCFKLIFGKDELEYIETGKSFTFVSSTKKEPSWYSHYRINSVRSFVLGTVKKGRTICPLKAICNFSVRTFCRLVGIPCKKRISGKYLLEEDNTRHI